LQIDQPLRFTAGIAVPDIAATVLPYASQTFKKNGLLSHSPPYRRRPGTHETRTRLDLSCSLHSAIALVLPPFSVGCAYLASTAFHARFTCTKHMLKASRA